MPSLLQDHTFFTQHLEATGSAGCELAFFRRKTAGREDDNEPLAGARTPEEEACKDASRTSAIAKVEAILEGNEANKRHRESRSTDFSVQECEDDTQVVFSPINTRPSIQRIRTHMITPLILPQKKWVMQLKGMIPVEWTNFMHTASGLRWITRPLVPL